MRKFANLWCSFLGIFAVCFALVGCSRLEKESSGGSTDAGEAHTGKTPRTALDNYVASPDTNYNFHLVKSVPGNDQTTFILEMTSQAWLTTNEVDRPLWKHWMTIVKPDTVTSSKSLLFIGGGGNGGSPPKSADDNMARIALATKSVVTELKMVPNQPLVFAGETEHRTEDSLIAYTWDKFLR